MVGEMKMHVGKGDWWREVEFGTLWSGGVEFCDWPELLAASAACTWVEDLLELRRAIAVS